MSKCSVASMAAHGFDELASLGTISRLARAKLHSSTSRQLTATMCSLLVQPSQLLPMACGPLFASSPTVGMHLDDGGVQTPNLYTPVAQAFLLLHRVPGTKACRQAAPLAAVAGHIGQGSEKAVVADAYAAAGQPQQMTDAFESGASDVHAGAADTQLFMWTGANKCHNTVRAIHAAGLIREHGRKALTQ